MPHSYATYGYAKHIYGNADPHKRAEYLMRRRQCRKKKEDGRHVTMGTNYEKLLRTTQHEKCNDESYLRN